MHNLSFGQAIEALQNGKKVSRSGWNGKGMWIYLMSAVTIPADKVNERTKACIGEGVDLNSQPYIVMWTADGKWQPGWTASQTDMLASDWEIIQ